MVGDTSHTLGPANKRSKADTYFSQFGPVWRTQVNKNLLKKVGVIAGAAVMASVIANPAHAKKVRWKMHNAYASNIVVIGPPANRIAEAVKKMSGGDFDIKVFEPGALAGGYAYYDPISQGGFEAAYGTSALTKVKTLLWHLRQRFHSVPVLASSLRGSNMAVAMSSSLKSTLETTLNSCCVDLLPLKHQAGFAKRLNPLIS